ncbi:MAG: ABC transporter permease [Bacteroidetes bacterium]|nr:ABC transporter permease [Bacteroidota bacterium]
MFRNYLKTAFRNLLRFKVYSFINVAGLALGMAACVTIFAFVQHEYSFDGFNRNANKIYRINIEASLNGKQTKFAPVPPSIGPYLMSQFPQIEHIVRLYALDMITSFGQPTVSHGQNVLRAHQFVLADSTFFDVFSFKMVQGNPRTALDAPFSVVITQDAAQELFGDENPIGKDILYNNKFHFTVTGVVQNPPSNSTIQFDYLGSLNSLPIMSGQPDILTTAIRFEYYTYLLINKTSNIKDVEQRLHEALDGYWDKTLISMLGLPIVHFELLRDSYWDTGMQYDIPMKGSRIGIMAFSVIALIILLVACANFINLSMARALARAKEIGIRKVVGGDRKQLIAQFMIESGLMSFVALVAAIALSEIFIPSINKALGMALKVAYLNNTSALLFIMIIWIATSLFAGVIPALYISSFKPTSVINWNAASSTKKPSGRKIFILLQFSAVIVLIFCTMIVVKEYNFLTFHDIGFNKDNIVVLRYDQAANGVYMPFKQKLLANRDVLGVTTADAVPGSAFGLGSLFFKDKSGTENMQVNEVSVDPDYIPVFGMKLLAGRNFSWIIQSDNMDAFILNATAVKKMGLTPQQAIGLPVSFIQQSLDGRIIGVVSDFNIESLRNSVQPLVLSMRKNVRMLAVKMSSTDIASTMAYIEKNWKQMFPNNPIEYNFLDKSLDALYKSEENLGILFTWFSSLAILIACSGLYGLALYAAEKRTKEVGIRKALGASVSEIVFLLSEDFGKWILAANVVALPLAYYFMVRWLENFAYRISIGIFPFILAATMSFVIAVLTVCIRALKAATTNPSVSLRCE